MAEKASGTTALQWVERLLEPSASEDMMIEAVSTSLLYNVEFCIYLPCFPKAQVISPGHYSDVVDERIISRLCGYPPCSNPLGPQPQQKYHISLALKKVFDLTQRKVCAIYMLPDLYSADYS